MRAVIASVLSLAACRAAPPAPPAPDAAAQALVCGEPPHGDPWTRFANVTAASGIAFQYASPDFRAGAIAAADLDGDGLPEVIAGLRTGGMAVYRNLGDMHFAPLTNIGIDDSIVLSAIAAVDLDNDGDRDLVLAGSGDTYVMANRGDGTFDQVAHFTASGTTEQVLAADLNGDGLLDLFLANREFPIGSASQNRLYINRGGMHFEFAGTVPPDALTWTATALDYDGDGDQDLYLSHDTLIPTFGPGGPVESSYLPPDSLLRNDGVDGSGVPHFTDVAPELGMTQPRSSMSGVLGDYDGDGELDLYVTNIGVKHLFEPADDTYVDRAGALGVATYLRADDVNVPEPCDPATGHEDCLIVSWSAALTDFDLDGYDELLVIDGVRTGLLPPPPELFVRGADPTYHEVSLDLGCPDGRGLVVTDLDGDGDQDVLIAQSNGPLLVFENQGTPPATAWLRVTLTGSASNREGVGAVVTAHLASGRSVIKVVGAGGVLNSAGPAEAFFGLGDDAVVELDVAWPSGRTSRLAGPLTGAVRVSE